MGNSINIPEAIEKARKQIENEPNLSPALKTTFDLLINLCLLLAQKWLTKDSKNSNIPPSADPNREKTSRAQGKRKPGGQPGHPGTTLQPVENPDKIVPLKIERRSLPPGTWKEVGWEKRQVIDLEIRRVVTEYQAEIVENEHGERITAPFPEGVVQSAQYGESVKAHAVYMSVHQMVPCERVSEHFANQINIPLSAGSVCNFKAEAYNKLDWYEGWVTGKLAGEVVLNCDETGINIGGKRVWLHNVSSEEYTLCFPHEKRGKEGMDAMGALGKAKGILVHDYWKAYYGFTENEHALCNAHLIRELTGVVEEGQKWAEPVIEYLYGLRDEVEKSGGKLGKRRQEEARKEYRKLLRKGDKECPLGEEKPPGKRGRAAKPKSRNLLERLMDREDEVLRFMTEKEVPFTNNQAERDLRMMKVQQKISGCFRSWEGAKISCRIRSYISTCLKQGMTASEAVKLIFQNKLPDFVSFSNNPAE
jgi:transposase